MFNNQLELKNLLRIIEKTAKEKGLDFDLALNDFEVDESECIHYDAFPCEDGSVYCPNCEKTICERQDL